LSRALSNKLALLPEADPVRLSEFHVPARHAATFPWVSHALWYYAQMVRWRQIEVSPEHVATARATYRPDLYRAALGSINTDLPGADIKVERFFDGRVFDPLHDVRAEPFHPAR
jgi:NitT/TauT family transport system ATP-binding protein